MRDLRRALARGGPTDTRAPEGCARVIAFHFMVDLIRILDEFKRRVEAGESCRLVHVKRSHESGRLQIEIAIEPQP